MVIFVVFIEEDGGLWFFWVCWNFFDIKGIVVVVNVKGECVFVDVLNLVLIVIRIFI